MWYSITRVVIYNETENRRNYFSGHCPKGKKNHHIYKGYGDTSNFKFL